MRKFFRSVLTFGVLISTCAGTAQAVEITGDPILDWNGVALEINRLDHSVGQTTEQGGPTRSSRALAIVHIAMYDAFVSIDGVNTPYLIRVPVSRLASDEAAVATAAHTALAGLYPTKRAFLDAELATYLGSIPTSQAKTLGRIVGLITGKVILAARRFDGKPIAEEVLYTPTGAPGNHDVDPLNPNQGFLNPGWGLVAPFGVADVDEFTIPPPPVLTSQEYLDAYNEVLSDGEEVSATRTADQTEIGLFWAYDGANQIGVPPRLYNQIVRTIAENQGNTPRDNARLFALVNIAMADAGIAAWNDKYIYDFWRPILAIRDGDSDGNDDTVGDPAWKPLGAPKSNVIAAENFTPPFPAYASGHSTFGAAALHMCNRFYGTDDIPFMFVSDELNGVTTDNQGNVRPFSPRSFNTLSEAIEENAQSRIYLGIHWQFDAQQGMVQGRALANRIFNTRLRPIQATTGAKVAGK